MTMPLAALYEWLKFLHVLAAMVWLGGLTVFTVLGLNVLRTGERDALARFVASFRVVGPSVLMPAAILVLVLGIWMVLDSAAWDFEQTWIWLALVLLLVAVLVGAVFLSRAAMGAQRAVDAGDDTKAARQLRRWAWGIRLILLLLVVATWAMVFKPGS
jgi:uncharacterized membrane protein